VLTVAALYIDPRGPYTQMPGVDCWDAERDARRYAGPHPVVTHPPCGPWGKLRHLSINQDATCGPRAVEQVRAFGGVLEHPAGSKLWDHCALPRPGELPDAWGGRSIEVEQVRWGHVARKRTWLYLVGVAAVPDSPPPREPTHWCSGYRERGKPNAKRRGPPVPPGIKIASAQQRRRTPQAFAEYLVALARAVRVAEQQQSEVADA